MHFSISLVKPTRRQEPAVSRSPRRAAAALASVLFVGAPLLSMEHVASARTADVPSHSQSLERPTSQSADPIRLDLPDDATDQEVRGEYGVGMVTLIIGGVASAAVIVGLLFVVMRKSWSTSH
jgi:hypothetical protein